MRGARLSARKNKPVRNSAENNNLISVNYITDNDIEKVIFGEELEQGEKKILKGIFEGGEEMNRPKHQAGKRPTNLRSDALKREIEKEVGVVLNKSINKQQSIKNTPTSERKRGRSKKIVVEESDEENKVKELCEKPSGLCDDDDVAGNEMCSFRTPKKRQGMYQKALESAGKISNTGTPNNKSRTPLRPLTPLSKLSHISTPNKRNSSVKRTPSSVLTSNKSTPLSKTETKSVTLNAETPYNLRARHKKDIQAHVRSITTFDDSGDSDYRSSDESPSESENSDFSLEKESSSSDSGKGSEEPKPQCRRSLRFHSLPSKKKPKDVNYVFTADEYFENQGGKCKTSDRRLSRLQTPRLENAALQDLLAHCSASHPHILADRRSNDITMFERWMFVLSQGFSILAYGLGSKYNILQNFHRTMLSDSRVLVVNGFFPSLNIKEIVEMIARDLLGLKQVLPTSHTIIDWIESRRYMPRVFLIVHNIDAEPLRSDKTQRILSRLASLPKIHLVASVDHINCPLLWDQAKLSGFNFIWEDTTSFLPYQEETSYETSLMVQNSGSLALSSLLNVYRSLTHNSRGVFRILLEKHLEENSQKYIGMAFSDLYKKCRDEMLVTNDLTLRTILTEFLDHQMVKWRRDLEHLYIPVERGVLQQFHKTIQDS